MARSKAEGGRSTSKRRLHFWHPSEMDVHQKVTCEHCHLPGDIHPNFFIFTSFHINIPRWGRPGLERKRCDSRRRSGWSSRARLVSYQAWADSKKLNEKNADRLKAIFQQHGCRKVEVRHRVPASVKNSEIVDCLLLFLVILKTSN